MLIAASSPLPQLPSLAPPTDGPAPEATPPSQSFARLLAQRREQAAAAAPQADKGDAAAAPSTRAATPSPTEPAQAAPQHGGPARETGKGRDGATRPAAKRGDAKAEANAADAAAGTARDSKDEAGPVDPALADWLARLQLPEPQQPAAAALPALPVPPVTPPATAGAETAAPASADADVSVHAVAGSGRPAADPGDVAKPVLLAATAEPARPVSPRGEGQHHGADTDAGDEPNKAPGAALQTRDTLPASADKLAATFSVPAPAAAQAVAAPLGHDATRPLPVVLDTPLAAPEFPQTLGVRIGVLAQGGIEHAELQLNPAEMGPVSVRIVVDGAQARVDFGADVAATRQAIEASLPELAGALREAGFTLTGGGVSQHAHPQRDGGGQGQTGSGLRGEPGQPGDTPAAPQRLVRAGGVDVYA